MVPIWIHYRSVLRQDPTAPAQIDGFEVQILRVLEGELLAVAGRRQTSPPTLWAAPRQSGQNLTPALDPEWYRHGCFRVVAATGTSLSIRRHGQSQLLLICAHLTPRQPWLDRSRRVDDYVAGREAVDQESEMESDRQRPVGPRLELLGTSDGPTASKRDDQGESREDRPTLERRLDPASRIVFSHRNCQQTG